MSDDQPQTNPSEDELPPMTGEQLPLAQDSQADNRSTGHSVLKRLGKTIDVPRVMLQDSDLTRVKPVRQPGSPEIPNGDTGSRYQLQGEIARGGMGVIIKCRDFDLGRDLAIKVLLDEHKERPEVIQRFIEEAQIGGQLQHPGIAPVYELGLFADQRPFFSMKLVKGKTLSKLLSDREAPADEPGKFIGIFEQICQTMAYAHSRGVIHRDLKPANIMVGAFGEVQVMDWGLAKVLSNGGVADEHKARDRRQGQSIIQTLRTGLSSNLPQDVGAVDSQTQMGSVMGTPAYMPPEQALGEIDQLDERADVFGLGAILCEILTGDPPYVGEDRTQIFWLASQGRLGPCFMRLDKSGADSELIGVTKRCLGLEPADRPRDAGELAVCVTSYIESVEVKLRESELERAAQAARADTVKELHSLIIERALLQAVAGDAELTDTIELARRAGVDEDWILTMEGVAQVHSGDNASAVNLLEKAVELNPSNVSAKSLLAWAYFHSGQQERWAHHVTFLDNKDESEPRDAWQDFDKYFLGYANFYRDYSVAVGHFDAVVDQHPSWNFARLMRAMARSHRAWEVLDKEEAYQAYQQMRLTDELLPRTPLVSTCQLFICSAVIYRDRVNFMELAPGLLKTGDAAAEYLESVPAYAIGAICRAKYFELTDNALGTRQASRDLLRGAGRGFLLLPAFEKLFIDGRFQEILMLGDRGEDVELMKAMVHAWLGNDTEALEACQTVASKCSSWAVRQKILWVFLLCRERHKAAVLADSWLKEARGNETDRSMSWDRMGVQFVRDGMIETAELLSEPSAGQMLGMRFLQALDAYSTGSTDDHKQRALARFKIVLNCNDDWETMRYAKAFHDRLKLDLGTLT